MSRWVLASNPKRILDPGSGTYVFERSISRLASSDVEIDAYEIDSQIISFTNPILAQLRKKAKVKLFQEDFMTSPFAPKYEGIICNPPYLKHHYVPKRRTYLRLLRDESSISVSLNTNVYCLFMIKAMLQLSDKGRMAFITPSEFLNANYGVAVKEFLLRTNRLAFIIVFDFRLSVFSDVLTTACILLFGQPRASSAPVTFIRVGGQLDADEVWELISGDVAIPSGSTDVLFKRIDELDPAVKWKSYFETRHSGSILVPFTRYARVMRGIATGSNKYFTFSKSDLVRYGISRRYIVPCITKALDARSNIFVEENLKQLIAKNRKAFLLYANGLEPDPNLKRYLQLGRKEGVDKRYLTRHRSPWWSSEQRAPAPILVTVFGRKGLRFVRNESEARNLTCFHSIYPTFLGKGFLNIMMAYLLTDFAQCLVSAEKRQYGDGLEKLEPNDINKSLVVDFRQLPGTLLRNIEELYGLWRKSALGGDSSRTEQLRSKLNRIFEDEALSSGQEVSAKSQLSLQFS